MTKKITPTNPNQKSTKKADTTKEDATKAADRRVANVRAHYRKTSGHRTP
jgi:hypothetical protein